jgi:glycine/D-amino acid oxidase-like deaminating enzyme
MHSYWENTTFLNHQDILIIGAGFTGLWSAVELAIKYPQKRITILERGSLPTGASTKNAGFSCFGSPTELIHDASAYGTDTMLSMAEKRYKGLQKINATFNNDALDYEPCGGYECLAENEKETVAENIDWLNQLMNGITKEAQLFHWLQQRQEIIGVKNFAAVVSNKLEGVLNPAKLIKALTQLVQSKGVQILYGITVDSYSENNQQIDIISNGKFLIRCHQLILATNAFTNQLTDATKITPQRGQVFISAPIENLPICGSFHYDKGYYYFRHVGNRLLLGGARNTDFENEQTTEFDTTESIQNTLMEFAHRHIVLPQPLSITQSWAGIMGFSESKIPVVKRLSNKTYLAAGMNGMGVALAPIIAEEVARIID